MGREEEEDGRRRGSGGREGGIEGNERRQVGGWEGEEESYMGAANSILRRWAKGEREANGVEGIKGVNRQRGARGEMGVCLSECVERCGDGLS